MQSSSDSIKETIHLEILDNARCPICSCNSAISVFKKGRLLPPRSGQLMRYGSMDTVLCSKCGLLYRYPVTTEEEIEGYYSDNYYRDYQCLVKNDNSSSLLDVHKEKKKNTLQYLKANIDFNSKRVLDAGCGRGVLLSLLAESSMPSYLMGLEPSTDMVKWCGEQNYPFEIFQGTISGFVNQTKPNTNKFDIVLLDGVLEHIPNPVREISALRELITENGTLWIYTHNETPGLTWNPDERISLVHVLYLTRETIGNLLAQSGFKVVKIYSRGTNMHVFAQASDRINYENKLPYASVISKYKKYRFSLTHRARIIRLLLKKIGVLGGYGKYILKIILKPWVPEIRKCIVRWRP